MLVMVVFFIAFRWIHLSTPLIRLFLLVLILLLMPTLNFLPGWFALSLLRFLFFSSRRRHTRCSRDWSQTCALPISAVPRQVLRPGPGPAGDIWPRGRGTGLCVRTNLGPLARGGGGRPLALVPELRQYGVRGCGA